MRYELSIPGHGRTAEDPAALLGLAGAQDFADADQTADRAVVVRGCVRGRGDDGVCEPRLADLGNARGVFGRVWPGGMAVLAGSPVAPARRGGTCQRGHAPRTAVGL